MFLGLSSKQKVAIANKLGQYLKTSLPDRPIKTNKKQ